MLRSPALLTPSPRRTRILVAFVFAVWIVPAIGKEIKEVEVKSSIGEWSVYCVKGVQNLLPQDCSLVVAAQGERESQAWVKVAFTVSSAEEMEMTIRVPRLDYFSKGIGISADGRQLGKAFIETCSDASSSCQSTVAVDSRVLHGLVSAKTANFEYQTGDEEGISLGINLDKFKPALGELRKIAGLVHPIDYSSDGAMAAADETFEVELRANTAGTDPSTNSVLGKPLKCHGVATATTVTVSPEFTIKDAQKLDAWLASTRSCSNIVYLITQPSQPAPGSGQNFFTQASKYTVYEKVRDKIPAQRIFFADSPNGIPLRFP
jgi:invasion protein IalB